MYREEKKKSITSLMKGAARFRRVVRFLQSVGRKITSVSLSVTMAVMQFAVFVPTNIAHAAVTDGQAAFDVLGQWDVSETGSVDADFTRYKANGGPFNFGVNNPNALAFDLAGQRLFVADTSHYRILVYNTDSSGEVLDTLPDNVLGQPDFYTAVNGPTASDLYFPNGLEWDPDDERLFVADTTNHRVMVWDLSSGITDGMDAAYVLGQPNFTTNTSGASISVMKNPYGLSYDTETDKLFVSSNNNRVLVYNLSSGITNGMDASNVLGQENFDDSGAVVDQDGLSYPKRIDYEESEDLLFVADGGANRVMVWDLGSGISNGANATYVLGQEDFGSSGTANDIDGMHGPVGVAYDASQDWLYVSEYQGNRVLVFDTATITNGEDATKVIGQPSFGSSTASVTQAGMKYAKDVVFDDTNDRLFVAQSGAARVTTYDTSSGITNGMNAEAVIGQHTFSSTSWPPTISGDSFTGGDVSSGYIHQGVSQPGALAIDTNNHHLFVADGINKRVIVYNLTAGDVLDDREPDYIIGQSDFMSRDSVTTQSGLKSASGVVYDHNNDLLFVSDNQGRRVLVFDLSSGITTGMNASYVIGQEDYVSSSGNTDIDGLFNPEGIAYDASTNYLYIADGYNNRVVVYDLSSGITNGMDAYRVLGQESFGANGTATDIDGMNSPRAVIWDDTDERLFVADYTNNRVLSFDLSSGITNGMDAANVLGQEDFDSGSSATTQDGLKNPNGLSWDDNLDRLFISDRGNGRVMIFDLSGGLTDGMDAANQFGKADFEGTSNGDVAAATMGTAGGVLYEATNDTLYVSDLGANRVLLQDVSPTIDPLTLVNTTNNAIASTRLAAGSSSEMSFTFNLPVATSTSLTITFPGSFTVTAAATDAGSDDCFSNFGFTSTTLTASKTNCSGDVTIGGATVTLPGTPGQYTVTWVNDNPGEGTIIVADDDQVTVSAALDSTMSFNAGAELAATDCDDTFSGDGGTVALGTILDDAVTSSDVLGIYHICSRVSTNATGGAVVTAKSLNAALQSTSVPGDEISSATATLVAGTEGYGLCVGSDGADTGLTTTDPVGASPTATSPFGSTCNTSGGEQVGALTQAAQSLWSVSGPTSNAFARVYVKAAISTSTPAHDDYSDTITLIATSTY